MRKRPFEKLGRTFVNRKCERCRILYSTSSPWIRICGLCEIAELKIATSELGRVER